MTQKQRIEALEKRLEKLEKAMIEDKHPRLQPYKELDQQKDFYPKPWEHPPILCVHSYREASE